MRRPAPPRNNAGARSEHDILSSRILPSFIVVTFVSAVLLLAAAFALPLPAISQGDTDADFEPGTRELDAADEEEDEFDEATVLRVFSYYVGFGSLLAFYLIYRRFLKRMAVPYVPTYVGFCAACGAPHAHERHCAGCGSVLHVPVPVTPPAATPPHAEEPAESPPAPGAGGEPR